MNTYTIIFNTPTEVKTTEVQGANIFTTDKWLTVNDGMGSPIFGIPTKNVLYFRVRR